MKEEEEAYHPDWDAYFCLIEDKPASIATDLDLRRFAPFTDSKWMVQISVLVREPDDNGLPRGSELETLSAIEDSLAFQLSEKAEAIQVGRAAFHGYRLFFFYCADTRFVAAAMAAAMQEFTGYKAELVVGEEPEWDTYFQFLLPDAREYQRIQNRKLLEQLEQLGDNADQERLVEHWLYFPTEELRTSFLKWSLGEGFLPIGLEKIDEDELPWKLRLGRNEVPTEEDIDEVVLLLYDTVQEFEGEYDGWETQVVRKDDAK
jgi:uncharacterized protein (TIGR01619 family)